MSVQPSDSILIVDFGSQVTQLIARRVREAGVYSEIAPFGAAEAAFARMKPRGVILSGSPASVLDENGPRIPDVILDSGLPMLGICYGQQALMHLAGHTLAIVGQVLRANAGSGQGAVDVQAELFGLTQVFEQGGNRGIAEVFHGFFLFCEACLDWR